MPALYLLDGMALAYRAHFAFIQRPTRNSKGVNTSALFGFTNALANLLEKHAPTHIAVVFDTDTPTARHREYAAYKATREVMPEDLSTALPYVQRLVEAFNIPVLALEGYEADDVIGTLAVTAERIGFAVFMVTPDKDFGQLVTDRIRILKPSYKGQGEELLGPDEICARWNIASPALVTDMLGLCGDTSDNIPGVPGIGPKTASKLLSEFGNLEGILENLGSLKGKLKEGIETHAESARLSKRLATININVPLDIPFDSLIRRDIDRRALQDLFAELEFRSLARRILGGLTNTREFIELESPPSIQRLTEEAQTSALHTAPSGDLFESAKSLRTLAETAHIYRYFKAPKDTMIVLEELSAVHAFCFDFETSSLDVHSAHPIGLAFSWQAHRAIWLALPNDINAARQEIRRLAPVFENPNIEKSGHNLKFDISILSAAGVRIEGALFDTMLAHALTEPEGRHTLDALAASFLNYSPISLEQVANITDGKLDLESVDMNKLAEYAAEDADITWQLRECLWPKVVESGQERVFKEIETPLVPVLAKMEVTGIALNREALLEVRAELERAIQQAEAEIFCLAGHSFQIGSPKQLGGVLFEELKLVKKPKKTATGQYATNEQTLQALAPIHPIVRRVLEYREALKLKNTYVDTLPSAVHPVTGRVHTTFSQLHTATGRLASSNPNLQNIPVRSELGRSIRKAFVPGKQGEVLLSADYSQIELRIIAGLSRDPEMLKAFQAGLDIHTATASKIYGVPQDKVSREMRAKAKMVNFGIPYGISPFGLAQRLGCSRIEAAELIDGYFDKFVGVREFLNRTISEARRRGFVETLTGRRRILRDINSANAPTRAAAERNAVNTPIQGTAADMIKLAMIRIAHLLSKKRLPARMLLQVHDELLFEVEESAAQEVSDAIAGEMRNALDIGAPVEVETGIGANWLEAH